MQALAKPGRRTRKILFSAAVLVCTAAVAGMGTFADFTSSTSASQTVASGTVTIALGATGASTNRLTVNASGIVPGDTMQRSFDIANSGSENLASVTLTTTASPSSVLDTDTTNGLHMVIEECSIAWVETGTSPAFSYTCAGTTTTRIASRAVIGANIATGAIAPLTAGATGHFRLTLTLPSGAGTDNTFQGKTSTITYAFTGNQRAASAH